MSTPYNRPESARQESYLTFTPRRAIASFDNLVVLANYEEHLREARKIVWRDRGEPAVDIRDIRECLVHGARGGLRTSQVLHHSSIKHPLFGRHHAGASAIAFAIRSGVNLVLLLARIKHLPRFGHTPLFARVETCSLWYLIRQKRLSLIRHALFGSDSFRAAAMLGGRSIPHTSIWSPDGLDRKFRGVVPHHPECPSCSIPRQPDPPRKYPTLILSPRRARGRLCP